jgi:hypothetical protein
MKRILVISQSIEKTVFYTLKKSVFWETQLGFPTLLLSGTFLGFAKKGFRGLGNPKVDDIVSDKNLAPVTDYPFPRRRQV